MNPNSTPEARQAMVIIDRFAPRAGETFDAQQSVERQYVRLLELGGPGVPEFTRRVLDGELGTGAAAVAMSVVQGGLVLTMADGNRPVVSLAAFCQAHGNLDVLRAVLVAGPPVSPPSDVVDGVAVERTSMVRWAEFVLTTYNERSAFDYQSPGARDLLGRLWSLCGDSPEVIELVTLVAAAFQLEGTKGADEALSFAWELDPDKVVFQALMVDSTPLAAAVREFYMRKLVELGDVQASQHCATASPPLAPAPRSSMRIGV